MASYNSRKIHFNPDLLKAIDLCISLSDANIFMNYLILDYWLTNNFREKVIEHNSAFEEVINIPYSKMVNIELIANENIIIDLISPKTGQHYFLDSKGLKNIQDKSFIVSSKTTNESTKIIFHVTEFDNLEVLFSNNVQQFFQDSENLSHIFSCDYNEIIVRILHKFNY